MNKETIYQAMTVNNVENEITIHAELGGKTATASCAFYETLNWVVTDFTIPKDPQHELIADVMLTKLQKLVSEKPGFVSLSIDKESGDAGQYVRLLCARQFMPANWSNRVLTWKQRGLKVRCIPASEISNNPNLSLLAEHYFVDKE